MTKKTNLTLAAALAALPLLAAPALAAGDGVLWGTVTSKSGEKLGGVTVSAKADGTPITTTVFTDALGNYYFPPLPAGSYHVWAQAITFAPGKSEVTLGPKQHQDFALQPVKDFVRQLPGDMMLASLPAATPEDARMQRLIRNNCTGCHTASYPLQNKFDEAGWTAIIDLMKRVNVGGIYQGDKATPNGILDFHEKELAAYLARARGPGPTSMKFKLRPRPTGEAARVVFKEYDVAIDPELGVEKVGLIDGSDWSLGTPPHSGAILHDSWAALDGNLWFTSNTPNHQATIGRIDVKTGAVKLFKVPGQNGYAAYAHGMTRAPDGMIWFNCNPGRGGLARLDPTTEKIDVFIPPEGMSPTGGATTVDYDGKGMIWASSPDGALRFDPKSESFTEFKSVTPKTAHGSGLTYGLAADRDGNGWWAEMAIDIVDKGVPATGKSLEVQLPPVQAEMDRTTPQERDFYSEFAAGDFNTPFPWAQGPRRMGVDKAADILWVGDSWGGNFAKIDTHTLKATFVPLPNPASQQPYHITVDSHHDVWGNLWTSDAIIRLDPKTSQWTEFDLPSRGTEARYISLLEQSGKMEVVVPYFRASKVAVMTFRSTADMQAAKDQAQ